MRHKQAFGYFRMGLVTGILDKQALVEWADQQILQDPVPEWEVIELSLSGHLPYSQLVRLLTGFQGAADYDLPLKALFARAGIWLEEDPGRAVRIIQGLRLLNEEEYLPADIRRPLADLDGCLDLHRQNGIDLDELTARLSAFLKQYAGYRSLVI